MVSSVHTYSSVQYTFKIVDGKLVIEPGNTVNDGSYLLDANQCLHANWYGVSLFNKSMDVTDVYNEFEYSRARFGI
jgi:hypothetical protein